MLKTKQPNAYYLGYDIGGTKCAIVLGNQDLNIHKKVYFDTKVERGLKRY